MSMENNGDTLNSYKQVRGLSRGLDLLRALNRVDGGASISQLSQMTGIHRTTVRRLLETLQHEGLLRRSPSNDEYRLTIRVRELSEGFRDEEWISSVSAPFMARLLEKVLWPSDLCTLDVDAMIIRETTHRFSKLSFHRAMVGRRLPLLQTAVGRTYLAYCPQDERRQLIDMLAARADPEHALARNPDLLQLTLERLRVKGYGENHKAWLSEEKFSSIAVPVRIGDQLLGCLNLVFLATAMSTTAAADRYLPIMVETAKKIEDAVFQLRAQQLRRF